MQLADVKAKRTLILDLAAKHGASNVRVFGSVVRGDVRAGSDIDLLVDFDLNKVSWGGGALLVELETLLGCRVDLVSPEDLHPRIRERVLSEAVPLESVADG